LASSPLPPEARLLFLTAGGRRNDAALKALLAEDLDWDALCWLAERENASCVLWRRLQAFDVERIPPAIRASLQRRAMVAEFRQVSLKDGLTQVVTALSRAGIEVMLLKGAALAQTAYGSFEDRPMTDLDLLVRREVAAKAQRVLRAEGWAPETPEDIPAKAKFYEGHHHLPPLDDARGTGVRVELHTELFPPGHPFRLTSEALWREADTAEIGGERARVPSSIHQLLHVCLHFAWSHVLEFGAWRAISDVEAMARSGDLDWDEFADLAHDANASTSAFWTLRLAHLAGNVEVPPEVMAALRPPVGQWVLRRLDRHFLAGLLPPTANCPSMRLRQLLWEAGIRPGHSGHGTSRPWARNKEFIGAAWSAERPRMMNRFIGHAQNRAVWQRYLRMVLR
jgi:hypothetical protein